MFTAWDPDILIARSVSLLLNAGPEIGPLRMLDVVEAMDWLEVDYPLLAPSRHRDMLVENFLHIIRAHPGTICQTCYDSDPDPAPEWIVPSDVERLVFLS